MDSIEHGVKMAIFPLFSPFSLVNGAPLLRHQPPGDLHRLRRNGE